MSRGRVVGVAVALLALVLAPRLAAACAACAAGDPTLTTMGAEQPFKGRTRVLAEVRYRDDGLRDGAARTELEEVRLDLGGSWAPRWWLQVGATVPLIWRDVRSVVSHDRVRELGDIELDGKATVWRDREWAPRRLLAVLAGLKLPTGGILKDDAGHLLVAEAQPGTGAPDLMLGLAWAEFAEPWSLYGSASGRLPVASRDDLRVGATLRSTLAVQYQPNYDCALRLGLNARLERPSYINHFRDPASGGAVVFVSPGLAVTPREDLVLEFSVNLPLVNLLDGTHDEGPLLTAGAVYDL